MQNSSILPPDLVLLFSLLTVALVLTAASYSALD
jgi:hypothetical protein